MNRMMDDAEVQKIVQDITLFVAGTIDPLLNSVVGETELELPMDRHLVLKIKGLSVGGGGIKIGNEEVRYLMLVRGERGKDIVSIVTRFYYILSKIHKKNLVLIQRKGQQYQDTRKQLVGVMEI